MRTTGRIERVIVIVTCAVLLALAGKALFAAPLPGVNSFWVGIGSNCPIVTTNDTVTSFRSDGSVCPDTLYDPDTRLTYRCGHYQSPYSDSSNHGECVPCGRPVNCVLVTSGSDKAPGTTRSACASWAHFWVVSEQQYEATQANREPPKMDTMAHRLSDAETARLFCLVDSQPHQIPAAVVGYATQLGAVPRPIPVDHDGWPLADRDVKPRICEGSQR